MKNNFSFSSTIRKTTVYGNSINSDVTEADEQRGQIKNNSKSMIDFI
ncbi:MAG: hypothetical protein IH852_10515 [Bacteroidetes bacterium]|nr:hypothetical protein [Bacteroidota bacterium]